MKKYQAEIISIGNEVLAGYTVNTNAAFISRELMSIGLPVAWVSTIRDEHDCIMAALSAAQKRADVVLVTGGLGPTPDDITKKSICEFFDVPMRENEQVLQDVRQFLAGRNIKLSDTNLRQALIPQCDILVRNKIGTAPGLGFERAGRYFFFMPGVPAEMKSLIKNFIAGYLQEHLELPRVHNRILRTTGIPESYLYDKINPLLQNYPQVQIAYLPRQIGVDLRFRLTTDKTHELSALDELIEQVRKKAGKYIFADREIELQEALGKLLAQKKQTLAVAESFSGGLIQDQITDIPGSSAYFLGGMVTYSNQAKMDFLNVQEETLKQFGAVSEQTAREMVRGVQEKFASDCAISTTGIAGPTGATEHKPIGLCYIAARYGNREALKEFHFGTVRRINKQRGAVAGMELLRRLILDLNG